jgi:hypothetical protein
MTTDRTAAERQRRYRERLREGGNSKLKREIERLKAKIAALQGKPANAARATKKATKFASERGVFACP